MPKIKLLGDEPAAKAKLTGKAFSKPAPGANLTWFLGTDHAIHYLPYLVKAVSLANQKLQFRGVNLEDPNKEFGPTGPNDHYEVDLDSNNEVYRHAPSTLANLEPGGDKTYAVLFLSQNFLNSKDPQAKLIVAQGDPKYPPVAFEREAKLRKEFEELNKAHVELKAMHQTLQTKYTDAANELKSIVLAPAASQSIELRKLVEKFNQ